MMVIKHALALIILTLFTFSAQSATITVGSGSLLDIGGANVVHSDLSIENGGELLLTSNSILLNDFSNLADGVTDFSNSIISVFGDWSNNGNLNLNGSSVNFIDGNPLSTVFGNTPFHELIITTTLGKTVTFEAGSITTISNNLVLTGVMNNSLVINSSSVGDEARFSLDRGATQSIDYVDVTDNYGVAQVLAPGNPNDYNSVQGNNVRGWFGVPLQLPVPTLSFFGQLVMILMFLYIFSIVKRKTQF